MVDFPLTYGKHISDFTKADHFMKSSLWSKRKDDCTVNQRKANFIIIRGRKARGFPSEIRGEDWDRLQRKAYIGMIPLDNGEDPRCTGRFEVVAFVPGEAPIKGDGLFYRGCNVMALPPKIAEVL